MLPYKDYQAICEYMEDIAPVHIHNSWNRIKDPYRVLTLSAPHNINYTAALEEELLKHQLSDGLDLEESDYHNVAVCLNAAIQKWHCV